MNAQNSSFSLNKYWFDNVKLSSSGFKPSAGIRIDINPRGTFSRSTSVARLTFSLKAFSGDLKEAFLSIDCIGVFKIDGINSIGDIPSYFFSNSIAILYPYLRTYVSFMSIQANFGCSIVLPVANLSSMKEVVKDGFVEIE